MVAPKPAPICDHVAIGQSIAVGCDEEAGAGPAAAARAVGQTDHRRRDDLDDPDHGLGIGIQQLGIGQLVPLLPVSARGVIFRGQQAGLDEPEERSGIAAGKCHVLLHRPAPTFKESYGRTAVRQGHLGNKIIGQFISRPPAGLEAEARARDPAGSLACAAGLDRCGRPPPNTATDDGARGAPSPIPGPEKRIARRLWHDAGVWLQ